METIIKLLLYSDLGNAASNWAMLIFRVLLSVELFRVHGLKKFIGINGVPEIVPNPLHLPQRLNNAFATLSDTVVPVFLILGLFTRIAILPTVSVTAIGYFIVHRNDPIAIRDVPYIYTICLLLMLVTGPGTLSLDHLIFNNYLNL